MVLSNDNAVLGMTVSKTIEDSNCDLELAVAWAMSAKNALKNVHGYSPNQLVFGKNPNYPCAENDHLPALESKTSSQVVADNLNALHAARKNYIELEASEKLKKNTRLYSDIIYQPGDIVFYKRAKDKEWKGPATVAYQTGQQVLLKQGMFSVQVHSCNITLKNEYQDTAMGADSTSSAQPSNASISAQRNNQGSSNTKSTDLSHNEYNSDDENEDDEAVRNVDVQQDVDPERNEHSGDEIIKNEFNGEIDDAHIQDNDKQCNSQNIDTDPERVGVMFDNTCMLKTGQFVECKTKDNTTHQMEVLARAGKATGKYVRDLNGESLFSMDWDNEEWKLKEAELVLISKSNIDKGKLALKLMN